MMIWASSSGIFWKSGFERWKLTYMNSSYSFYILSFQFLQLYEKLVFWKLFFFVKIEFGLIRIIRFKNTWIRIQSPLGRNNILSSKSSQSAGTSFCLQLGLKPSFSVCHASSFFISSWSMKYFGLWPTKFDEPWPLANYDFILRVYHRYYILS